MTIYSGVGPDIHVTKRFKKRMHRGWEIEITKREDGYVYADVWIGDYGLEPFVVRAKTAVSAEKQARKYIDKLEDKLLYKPKERSLFPGWLNDIQV